MPAAILAVAAVLALSCGAPSRDPVVPEAGAGAAVENAAPVTRGETPVAATESVPTAAPAPETIATTAPAVPAPPAVAEVVDDRLRRGDTLAASLARNGVDGSIAHVIDRELREVFDFRRARPGHRYHLALDEQGELLSFQYEPSRLDRYRLERDGEEWKAGHETAPISRRRARLAGVVTTSLYDAIQDLGEEPQLARDFADVFAWDLDFSRAVQPGDEFRVLYERTYLDEDDGRETYLGPGRILAAHYSGAGGSLTAVYYETEEGRGGYYRPDGSSVERSFLAAPLSYSRISSSYTNARFHPILKVRRPHHGIDYAAPTGTPVWSVAHGKIVFKGWAGGFGRLVKVEHANGYVSYYAHLSRFAKGLKVGQRVQQKQVVGYVGSSGLATGPHVCFRIARNGRYVDPNRIRAPAGDPVPEAKRGSFETVRDHLLAALGPSRLVATDEAL